MTVAGHGESTSPRKARFTKSTARAVLTSLLPSAR
jgi:hypothetical protein